MLNYGNITAEDGENFSESAGVSNPPPGWGTFTVMEKREWSGNLIFDCLNDYGQKAGIFLALNGDEKWQKDRAAAICGRLMQIFKISGSMNDEVAIRFLGQRVDLKIKVEPGKGKPKLDGSGNWDRVLVTNFAPAGTRAGAQQVQQQEAPPIGEPPPPYGQQPPPF